MIKIIYNNMIIDVCEKENFVRYLPQAKRFVGVKEESANAIVGSNSNTLYHIEGTDYNFSESLKTVRYEKIKSAEYKKLTSEMLIQNIQQLETQTEIDSLKTSIAEQKKLITEQTNLIQLLLQKLS